MASGIGVAGRSSWSASLASGGQIKTSAYAFDDSDICSGDPLVHVSGMEVHVRLWDGRPCIGGLKVFYSNGHATTHGGTNFGYEVTQFTLLPGELIGYVDARSGWLVDALIFTTIHNRVVGPFGGPGGSARSLSPPDVPNGQGFLACIRGQVVQTQGSPAITNLQFQWRYKHCIKKHVRTTFLM